MGLPTRIEQRHGADDSSALAGRAHCAKGSPGDNQFFLGRPMAIRKGSMTVLITTNEPKAIRELFVDRIEVPMPFDGKLYTENGVVGLERKKVPGDLLSSVADGRLAREILTMREECQFMVILLHGKVRYRSDGTVNTGRRRWGRSWTKKGLRNLYRTLQVVEGCYLEYPENNRELVECVNEIQAYFDTTDHFSLKGRPSMKTDWVVPTRTERVRYFYDGLPGIGIISAKSLCSRFPSPLNLYQASVEQIMEVKGFGKPSALQVYNFLRGL